MKTKKKKKKKRREFFWVVAVVGGQRDSATPEKFEWDDGEEAAASFVRYCDIPENTASAYTTQRRAYALPADSLHTTIRAATLQCTEEKAKML